MRTSVRIETVPCRDDMDGTVYVLRDYLGGEARIWPALGFNCLSFTTPRDVLWADPQVYTEGRPTRSGIPILFPFPNRIRDGRFTWNGQPYQLPINDAQKKN